MSRRRVLDLRTSDPQAGPWLLRSEVFTEFDGRRWRNAARPARPSAAGPGPRPSSIPVSPRPCRSPPRRHRCMVSRTPPGTPGGKEETRGGPRSRSSSTSRTWTLAPPAAAPRDRRDRRRALPRGGPLREHTAPAGLPVRLYGARLADVAPAGPTLSDDDRSESLALPAVVDQRLRALAHGLAADADPRGRLDATVAHLREGYRYTLHPGAFHTARPSRRVPVREEGRLLRVLRERGRRPPPPPGSAGPLRQGPERGAADRPGRRAPRRARQRRTRLGRGMDPRRGLGRGRPDAARPVRRRARPRGLLPAAPPARARGALRRHGLAWWCEARPRSCGGSLATSRRLLARAAREPVALARGPHARPRTPARPVLALSAATPARGGTRGEPRRLRRASGPRARGRATVGGPRAPAAPGPRASSSTRARLPRTGARGHRSRPGRSAALATSSRPTTGRGSAASRRTRPRRPGSATSCGPDPPPPRHPPPRFHEHPLTLFGPSLSIRHATIRRIGGETWQVRETLPRRPTGA